MKCQLSSITLEKIAGKNRMLSAKHIMKTCLFKYTENSITKKLKISRLKKSDIFLISAQNIDCGYSLEPT